VSNHEHAAVHVHRDDIGTRMGMWLFLFTELILFGGMFFLYSVYRFMHAEAFHIAAKELNTLVGTFNTIILLTSSLTMALSIIAIQKDKKNLSIFFQLLTILLALGFMLINILNGQPSLNMVYIPGHNIFYHRIRVKFFFLAYTML